VAVKRQAGEAGHVASWAETALHRLNHLPVRERLFDESVISRCSSAAWIADRPGRSTPRHKTKYGVGQAKVSGQLQTVDIRQLGVQQSQGRTVARAASRHSGVQCPDAPAPVPSTVRGSIYQGRRPRRARPGSRGSPLFSSVTASDGNFTVKVLPFRSGSRPDRAAVLIDDGVADG